ncbi:MAG: glycosyltransferase family 4 protein [Anaerolineae bacterium]|jgi:glycosyltransferase involved in cell wall biosynthesis|nr:glycosyltransferase family 4 protein [Anaerolineae bacterium]
MRIGLVTGEYPPMQGGIAAHCRILAQTLSAQGHSVMIYTDPQGQSDDPAIPVTHHRGRWRYAALKAIDNWVRREQLDIVNLHYQTAAYQMSPFIHFMPEMVRAAPVITTFHDLRFPYLFPKAGRLRDWIVMRLARASAGVIATNHEDLTRLRDHRQQTLIPIGSSVHTALPEAYDREQWRGRFGASPDDFVIAHFGFINHSKGVNILLSALSQLVAAGYPFQLLMIGGRTGASDPTNSAYADQLDQWIASSNLTDRVHWTGYVEDTIASAYFAAADVIALPFLDGASYRRSSLMAAIAHETAIVSTKPRVSIPPFRNADNLMLIAPNNIPALAAVLQVLYRDRDLRAQLRHGAAQLKETFAWGPIARANADFFRQVIEAQR